MFLPVGGVPEKTVPLGPAIGELDCAGLGKCGDMGVYLPMEGRIRLVPDIPISR